MTENERDARVGRNQSMFRAVNEGMRELNDGFASITRSEDYSIVCECADLACTESVLIRPGRVRRGSGQPAAVRRHPRACAPGG